jgi:hypothetical protein
LTEKYCRSASSLAMAHISSVKNLSIGNKKHGTSCSCTPFGSRFLKFLRHRDDAFGWKTMYNLLSMSRWMAPAGGLSQLYCGRFPYSSTTVRYEHPISTSCGMPSSIFVLETKAVKLICFEEHINQPMQQYVAV